MRVLYFAWVREAIGRDEETIDLPAGIVDVAGLVGWLAARGGGHAEALGNLSKLRYAVDEAFVGPDAGITQASEVAIFPPVTGG